METLFNVNVYCPESIRLKDRTRNLHEGKKKIFMKDDKIDSVKITDVDSLRSTESGFNSKVVPTQRCFIYGVSVDDVFNASTNSPRALRN
ncbi:unnamed protein product [Clavelina lepadiformis]|uniref:Uncharacterized protein n=1 Tax=Clavelina lepadiformis TaxID=159417 RepID=A0ABP0GWN3_CLALP